MLHLLFIYSYLLFGIISQKKCLLFEELRPLIEKLRARARKRLREYRVTFPFFLFFQKRLFLRAIGYNLSALRFIHFFEDMLVAETPAKNRKLNDPNQA